jgi:hypothetical protein
MKPIKASVSRIGSGDLVALPFVAVFSLLAMAIPAGSQTPSPNASDVANEPATHVGDVWVDRLSGGDKQYKIDSVDSDGNLVVDQWGTPQTTDKDWNIITTRSLVNESSPTTKYAKPLVIFPFPLTSGKTWKDEVKWQVPEQSLNGKTELEGKIDKWEDVTVPAGTFHAIKAIVTERAFGREGYHDEGTLTYWYAPQVNRFVKFQYQSINEGQISADMVSYKPASH